MYIYTLYKTFSLPEGFINFRDFFWIFSNYVLQSQSQKKLIYVRILTADASILDSDISSFCLMI